MRGSTRALWDDGQAFGRGDARAGNGASATLADRLDAIGEGIRLRAPARRAGPRCGDRIGPAQVVCGLAELQRLAGEELTGLRPGTARHREVATRARNGWSRCGSPSGTC